MAPDSTTWRTLWLLTRRLGVPARTWPLCPGSPWPQAARERLYLLGRPASTVPSAWTPRAALPLPRKLISAQARPRLSLSAVTWRVTCAPPRAAAWAGERCSLDGGARTWALLEAIAWGSPQPGPSQASRDSLPAGSKKAPPPGSQVESGPSALGARGQTLQGRRTQCSAPLHPLAQETPSLQPGHTTTPVHGPRELCVPSLTQVCTKPAQKKQQRSDTTHRVSSEKSSASPMALGSGDWLWLHRDLQGHRALLG